MTDTGIATDCIGGPLDGDTIYLAPGDQLHCYREGEQVICYALLPTEHGEALHFCEGGKIPN